MRRHRRRAASGEAGRTHAELYLGGGGRTPASRDPPPPPINTLAAPSRDAQRANLNSTRAPVHDTPSKIHTLILLNKSTRYFFKTSQISERYMKRTSESTSHQCTIVNFRLYLTKTASLDTVTYFNRIYANNERHCTYFSVNINAI